MRRIKKLIELINTEKKLANITNGEPIKEKALKIKELIERIEKKTKK